MLTVSSQLIIAGQPLATGVPIRVGRQKRMRHTPHARVLGKEHDSVRPSRSHGSRRAR